MPDNPTPRRGRPRKDGKPANHWPSIIQAAANFAGEYEFPPSLRRIFYRLVASGLLPNTATDYSSLCSKTAEARRGEGNWCDFPDLDDSTRSLDRPAWWSDPKSFALGNPRGFRVDRDASFDVTIILAVEKRGLLPSIWSWYGGLGFACCAIGGYHSQPFEQDVLRYIEREGRPARILFGGDHDASGDDLVRNLERRLCLPGTDVTLQRVALTRPQVEEFGLPSWGGKEKDTRWPGFAERHGYDPQGEAVQVELDALPLDTLRDLYAAGIGQALGLDFVPSRDDLFQLPAIRAAIEEERQGSRILEAISDRWDDVVAFLNINPDTGE